MKSKLELAHEFMLAMIGAGCTDGRDLLERAWEYADAMEVEVVKRLEILNESERGVGRVIWNTKLIQAIADVESCK